jgi:serine/threonine protein kinase
MPANATNHPADALLNDYLSGRLSEADALGIHRHLAVCPECHQKYSSLYSAASMALQTIQRDTSATPSTAQVVPAPIANAGGDQSVPDELKAMGTHDRIEELGRGGMGVVYRARNIMMDRLEVLKLLSKRMLGNPDNAERFLREIRAAGRLSHPNLVTAYSAGQYGDLLVFAMEYIPGDNLSDHVKKNGPCDVAVACEIVCQVAAGLQHAFEKGMVHRDIKPGNLMLLKDGSKTVIKILDFGLAKATSDTDTSSAHDLTGAGKMLGTPDYIAPEQTLDATRADIRADIYSLGCTLYFLLTGRPPFQGKTLYELLQKHHTAVAPLLHTLRSDVPIGLSNVVHKMMAKNPDHRYATPTEVIREIRTVMRGGVPVGNPTVVQPMPAPVANPAPVPTMPALPIAATPTIVPQRAETQAADPWGAATELDDDDSRTSKSSGSRSRSKPPTKSVPKTLRKPQKSQTKWPIVVSLLGLLVVAAVIGLAAGGAFSSKAKFGTVSFDLQNPFLDYDVFIGEQKQEITRIERTGTVELKLKPGAYEIEVRKPGYAPLSQGISVEGNKVTRFTGKLQVQAKAAANVGGGVASKNSLPPNPAANPVPVWETKTVWELRGHTSNVLSVAYSADGTRIATGSGDRTVFVLDANNWGALHQLTGHMNAIWGLAFFQDGSRIVTGSWDQTARIWDAKTGASLFELKGHTGPVTSVAVSPDGSRIATASNDLTVKIWNANTGLELRELKGHTGFVMSVAFSPDGSRLLSGSDDRTAKIWDVETGRSLLEFRGHTRSLRSVAFHPNGKQIATASEDRTVRLWDVNSGGVLQELKGHTGWVMSVAFRSDGNRIVTGSDDKTIRIWDAITGDSVAELKGHTTSVMCVAFNPDGSRIVSGSSENFARVWIAKTAEDIKGEPVPNPPAGTAKPPEKELPSIAPDPASWTPRTAPRFGATLKLFETEFIREDPDARVTGLGPMNGHFTIACRELQTRTSPVFDAPKNCAIVLQGRLRGSDLSQGLWGISIVGDNDPFPLHIGLSGDKKLYVDTGLFAKDEIVTPRYQPYRVMPCRAGEEYNSLMIVMNEGELSIYVNGEEARPMLKLNRKYFPGKISVLGKRWGGNTPLTAEIDRLAVYSIVPGIR